MTPDPNRVMLHASCVNLDGQGVLIRGASGTGKSALALQLIALRARLVADDQTVLVCRDNQIFASAPKSIEGLIEARGVGLIALPFDVDIRVVLDIDLDQTEQHRLPILRHTSVLDRPLPSLHKVEAPHFPAAILAYLVGTRKEPHD